MVVEDNNQGRLGQVVINSENYASRIEPDRRFSAPQSGSESTKKGLFRSSQEGPDRLVTRLRLAYILGGWLVSTWHRGRLVLLLDLVGTHQVAAEDVQLATSQD